MLAVGSRRKRNERTEFDPKANLVGVDKRSNTAPAKCMCHSFN